MSLGILLSGRDSTCSSLERSVKLSRRRLAETDKDAQKNSYIRDLERVGQVGIVRAEFFTLVWLMTFIPFGKPRELARTGLRLAQHGRESVERYWKNLKADPENAKPTLLTKEYGMVERGEMPLEQLIRDASGYIVAGTDTTSNTLTFCIWELTRHPEVERALIEEIAGLPEDFNDEEIRKLKTLECVLNETLRLHSIVAAGLPRHVPPEGAEFAGHFIPGGTTVAIQAHTMHREPSVWPEPERWNPSRWNHVTKEMKDHFVPFGGGSRSKFFFLSNLSCPFVGMRVAQWQQQLTLC